MTALGLGDIAAFPFVEPPDRRSITRRRRAARGAGRARPGRARRRSGSPRSAASWPSCRRPPAGPDGAGGRPATAALREVLVIAAALSIQDPRERPPEQQQAADEKHARFADPDSDFLAYLNLWHYLQEQQQALSSNQFRRLCRTEFLNYLRVREWQDLYEPAAPGGASGMGITRRAPEPADPTPGAHRRCWPACCPTSALRSDAATRRAPSTSAPAAPGSPSSPARRCSAKPPRWVMAAELVETTRLWAPGGGEDRAGVGRARSPGTWSSAPTASRTGRRDQGSVVALREGHACTALPLVAGRKVHYGRIDPELSPRAVHPPRAGRGRLADPPRVLPRQPRRCSTRSRSWRHRARRRDILVDDETLFAFYDARVAGRRRLRRATSTPGGSRPGATEPGPADLRPRRC